MGGLTTVKDVSGMDCSLEFIDEEGREQPFHLHVKDQSRYTLKTTGEIAFVQCPDLPAHVSSAGLRMSSLSNPSSDYLKDTHKLLKRFLADEKVSLGLPKSLSLIKDRSKLVHEEDYMPEIRRAIATETIKRAAYELLTNSNAHLRGIAIA